MLHNCCQLCTAMDLHFYLLHCQPNMCLMAPAPVQPGHAAMSFWHMQWCSMIHISTATMQMCSTARIGP